MKCNGPSMNLGLIEAVFRQSCVSLFARVPAKEAVSYDVMPRKSCF